MARRTQKNRSLIEFEDSLLLIVDADQLTHNLRSKLKQFLDVESVVVYLMDIEGACRNFRQVKDNTGDSQQLPLVPATGKMANWFRVNREILWFEAGNPVVQYLRDELQPFREAGMQLASPLISMERLIGLVFLRLQQTPLRETQAADLRMLSRQAGLAFENALLFKEQLRQNERMHRAEQLATMGQFAAGIAHELRNPLTAIRSTIQFLAEEFAEQSEQRKLTNTMLDEIDRLNGIVDDLLSLARPAESRPVAVDLQSEIDKSASFLEARARSQNVRLEIACAEQLPVLLIDPAELRQVLLNILMNGLQAMPNGGTLCLRAHRPDHGTGPGLVARDEILIEITDEGPGIPTMLRERVFDPFFTTKLGGTGLGLPVCRSIVRRYEGDIWLEGAPTGGTVAKILLPCE